VEVRVVAKALPTIKLAVALVARAVIAQGHLLR
jgi:hypothetical protein